MAQYWKYIGDPKLVTSCNYRYDGKIGPGTLGAVCNNGSCPGEINNICPFANGKPCLGVNNLFELRDDTTPEIRIHINKKINQLNDNTEDAYSNGMLAAYEEILEYLDST